ncbi:MAG: glycosyltransferase, partial [Paludibacter sp.]
CKLNKFYNFNYIQLYEENKGANYAQAIGIENTNADIIVFIDPDLLNIKEKHFTRLFLPLVNNEADLVLGLAENTLIDYKIKLNKSLYITRTVFRKDILCILGDFKSSKYSIDTILSSHYQFYEKKIKYIALEDINNL